MLFILCCLTVEAHDIARRRQFARNAVGFWSGGARPRVKPSGRRNAEEARDDERSQDGESEEPGSRSPAWMAGRRAALRRHVGPKACAYSARTVRSFSSAFACKRETCICETLRRLAISVCETDS